MLLCRAPNVKRTLAFIMEQEGDKLISIGTLPDGHGEHCRGGDFFKCCKVKQALGSAVACLAEHVAQTPFTRGHNQPAAAAMSKTILVCRCLKNGVAK